MPSAATLINMAPRPTLAKVALAAGVSKTTASYVLNGQKKMSAETTRRVTEAARQLGYRLDSAASGLSRGRSQVIGVLAVESVTELVVGANSLFWLRFNDAFIRHCSEEGLVVSFAGERKAQELIDSGIDALVVLGNHATEVFEELRVPFGLPIISLDPIPGHDNVQLSYDNDAIAAAVAGHLMDQGCTHLNWLSIDGAQKVLGPLQDSLERWTAANGLAFSTAMHDSTAEGVQRAVDKALDDGADGFFSALGIPRLITDALANRGRTIPDDVLLVIQAEGLVEQSMTPSITTMSYRSFDCGTAVADMCVGVVRDGSHPATVPLEFELVIRESSLRNP